ncbi:MAG: radical SAM family heme chaperone HemW [Acidiferrobacterales bacterium]
MFNISVLPPLSLYIHLPWCVRKCPYCDFNSYRAQGEISQGRYIDALLRDLDQELPGIWGRRIRSIFLGGGTPSLFTPESIDTLLSGARARLPFDRDTEITLEANPGVVDAGHFQGFRDAGVNRLSIGVQSFEPEKLVALGRIHGSSEAVRAIEMARAAGFDNINLDLMFGLPEQTPVQALADLRTAISFQPDHISLYQLTIEPNTVFHVQRPVLPMDDAIWQMQCELQALLATHDYRQYEVSAYAREAKRCRHNLNYWRFGDYLGIGAGAHGKISDPHGSARRWKLKHPNAFMAQAGTPASIAGERRLAPQDAILEFMMNTLRLTEGFPTRLFQERTGLPTMMVLGPLRSAERKGLLQWDARSIRPSENGRRFLNDLLCLFMPDARAHADMARQPIVVD